MPTPLGAFAVTRGFPARENTADTEQLYLDPDELSIRYGMSATEGQIRFAMSLIHSYVGRPSLWVEEYEERIDLPEDRNQVILAARPVVSITRAWGRYGYGRRDRRTLNQTALDFVAATAVWGSPPAFQTIDVDQIEFFGATGECWLPTGFFLVNYSQIQIVYTSGFPRMPQRVLDALAETIHSVCTRGHSDRAEFRQGLHLERYSTTGYLTGTARDLLDPYVCRALM